MPIADVERALKTARESQLPDFPVRSVPVEDLEFAERQLGVEFPPSLREYFLLQGVGGPGLGDFNGLIPGHLDLQSEPNIIWITNTLRAEVDLPKELLPVRTISSGVYACVDTSNQNGAEARVIEFDEGIGYESTKSVVLASDFGAYILSRINEQVG